MMLSAILCRLRGSKNLVLQQAADACNVSRSLVCSWEHGRCTVGATHLATLLDLYGASPDDRRAAWSAFHGVEADELGALFGFAASVGEQGAPQGDDTRHATSGEAAA